MKKLTLTALFAAAFAISACENQYREQQTFGATLPTTVISVQQALSAKDDSYVTVEGHLIRQLDDDEYLFADTSGQIRVEIDNSIWQGKQITPQDRIRLYGEIDKEWNKTELKVRELSLIK